MIELPDDAHDGARVLGESGGEPRDQCRRHDRVAFAGDMPSRNPSQDVAHVDGIERTRRRREAMMPCPGAVIEISRDRDASFDVGAARRDECRDRSAAGVPDERETARARASHSPIGEVGVGSADGSARVSHE